MARATRKKRAEVGLGTGSFQESNSVAHGENSDVDFCHAHGDGNLPGIGRFHNTFEDARGGSGASERQENSLF
jgi:hypothetical protein